MNRSAVWAGALAVFVLAVVAFAVMVATNAVRDDVCSAAYRRCAAVAGGLVATMDCRVEVFHCRSVGHFEFPDGTVEEFPVVSADVGQN